MVNKTLYRKTNEPH